MKIAMLIPDNRDEFRRYDDPDPLFGPAPTALLEGLAQRRDCEIHIVCCAHRPLRAPSKIAENIYYHCVVVPTAGWRPTGYAGCVLAIRRKLRSIRPDIVHGQGTERYCALAAVFGGFPNVITIHGNMLGMARFLNARIGTFYWCAASFESFALKRTGGVFCNSAYTEKMVRSRTRTTWRVSNALRSIFFEASRQREPAVKPALLNVGTIAPHKRQVELLHVARRLFEEGHRFLLLFIGGLPANEAYSSEFTALIAKAERDGFAKYYQPQSDKELLQCFDESDALIHFPREEAFGLVVAESLARNLKFLGARVGGIPDIADSVEMAELFEPDDYDGLRHGLSRWLNGTCLKPHSAAAEMEKRYHPIVIADRHLKIYQEVVGPGKGN